MRHRKPNSESGMAMMVAMTFIAVALLILAGLSARLMQQRIVVDRYHDYRMAFEGLEAAVANSRAQLESGGSGIVGLEGWTPEYDGNKLVLPSLDASGVDPKAASGLPGLDYIAYTANWFTDGRDNTGDGLVDNEAERHMYSVHARARYGGTTRNVEVVFAGQDVNVWRNAIFAGAGQAGGLVNGNVSIHGSVHLLGDGLLTGLNALAAIDLSGTSLIHNNYQGVPASITGRVPPLPQREFQGEIVSTIDSVLRVKRGRVGMSGNSEIGEPHISGNSYKETMDATYVNDGWTGNSVTPDGGRGIPSKVFSDNGWNERYDLGDRVKFPRLSDDWREVGTGARVARPDTGAWYSHEEYFSEVLLADPADPADGIHAGNIQIAANGGHFYWNATTGQKLVNALPAVAPAPTDDYILFNSTTKVLTANGQIRINGDLTFSGQGNQQTVHYSGRAAILATGNIVLNTNLLPCNNGNPNDIANSFPVNNILGFMAKGNMTIGATAQRTLLGAFYSEQTIDISKQSHIGGTIVGNYFDMGTNVPNIYQVPTLADNLPYGMIGNYPIISMQQVSWRETAG